MRWWHAIALAVPLISGCYNEEDQPEKRGQGNDSVMERGQLVGTYENAEGGKISFFEDGRFSARVGCNAINGSFVQTGNTISFPPPYAGTSMACSSYLEQRDAEFLVFLETVSTVKGEGDTVILVGTQQELSFRKTE